MHLTHSQIIELIWAVTTIGIAVGVIYFIKWLADYEAGPVGLELNLLTYGYLADTIIKAAEEGKYWHLYSSNLIPKNLLLTIIVIGNFVMLGINIKYEIKIRAITARWPRLFMKFKMQLLGLISAALFLTCKVLFGE
ncbi:MAG: hypothetical protein QM726_14440 [Chitinophagaceae bacterium]